MKTNLAEKRFHGELDFPISIYNMDFEKEEHILAPLHHHPEFELLLVTSGQVELQIEEKEYHLHQGQGVFINSSCLHAIYSENNQKSSFLATVFSSDLLAERTERIYKNYLEPIIEKNLLVPMELSKQTVERLVSMADLYFAHPFGYELVIKGELLQIMSELCSHASEHKKAHPNSRFESIKHALTYIETHYMDEITLGELAHISGLSREHFCRVFSELAGMSPINYLNRLRIRQSIEFLRDTDKSISEISELCGFGSCSYYNKIFRRFENQTPKQYRQSFNPK